MLQVLHIIFIKFLNIDEQKTNITVLHYWFEIITS